ncbi:aminopeptidase P family N-terminal domain-containing protein [Mesorhizobium sp. M1348]|uniref:aminopeptidase P family N-terminal domain-containing protein n=1 Tax=Mesorhizobium sp. M1348 TaxID=2957089 RepID=UPI003339DC99
MTTAESIPFTGAPFPKSEYERRQKKVLEEIARSELDALVVTAHGHLQYLSGYDGTGAYFMPFPLIRAGTGSNMGSSGIRAHWRSRGELHR